MRLLLAVMGAVLLSMSAAPAANAAEAALMLGHGLGANGELLGPVGPLRACPDGGTTCLTEGTPLAIVVNTLGSATPPFGPLLLAELRLHGIAAGTTRAATLRPLADGGYQVIAVSAPLAVVPGPNSLRPMTPVTDGDVVALTDARALAFSAGDPPTTGALSPIGAVGDRVERITGPEHGQLVSWMALDGDRDGDGATNRDDYCHGPGTGAICAVTPMVQASARPDAVTAGQRAWIEVAVQADGAARDTQPMGAEVDVVLTPADADVQLPGECAVTGRDPVALRVRCRASYLLLGRRPVFALQVTAGRPGGAITATATLARLRLRDVDRDVPFREPPVPSVVRVPVRGYEAFRARATLLRSRSPNSIRLRISCPAGWILTSCPVTVKVTSRGLGTVAPRRTLRLAQARAR